MSKLKLKWCMSCGLLLLSLLFGYPAAAMDGGGGGGGGGGGDGGGSGVGGVMGTWGGWNVERKTMLRSDVRAFLAERRSNWLSQPRTYEPVPDEPDYVTLVFLAHGVPVVEDGSDDEEGTDEAHEDAREEALEEAQRKADAEMRKQLSRKPESQPDPIDTLNDIPDDAGVAGGTADISGPAVGSAEVPGYTADDIPANRTDNEQTPVSSERYTEIVTNTEPENMEMLGAIVKTRPDLRNDEKGLVELVNKFNRNAGKMANRSADTAQTIETTLSYVDKTGQTAQTALSFVPGVGWVTSLGLDAARSGANAYRDDKTAGEIMTETLKGGTVSVVTNKLIGGSSFRNAKSVKGEVGAIFSGQKNAVAGYGRQLGGWLSSKVADTALNNQAKPTKYARPTYDVQTESFTTSGGHTVQK